MQLSDLSVKRPVFAIVLSLLLCALGLMAFQRLPLREVPNIDPPVVNIDTIYRGASAQVVETRVTQILEDAVSGISGIALLSSVSNNGRSSITVEFNLTREIDSAANDVRDAVSRTLAQLPQEIDPPQVAKVDGDAEIMIWLNLASAKMDALELADYADRYLVDRLSVIDGVARVSVAGAQRYAMRVNLNSDELAARGLTVSDVIAKLRQENIEMPAGRVESQTRDFIVRIPRAFQNAQDFRELVLRKGDDGHLIRLAEVANVELAAAESRTYFRGNGQPQVGLGIIKQSTANALEVSRAVKAKVAELVKDLPEGTQMVVAVDTSEFIEASIHEVYFTLAVTIGLVIAVIYLFLGSWRAAIIPAVTVPVCVVTSFIFLSGFGFSLNLLTLLALILSIGLVVDDAIVVLENCQRRMDQLGESSLMAAYRGTRQVSFAVLSTTAVLVAVFLPIAFMEGNLGRLFRELAVAMASAVAVSAFVALSLSPVMCAAMLKRNVDNHSFASRVEHISARWSERYRALLTQLVRRPSVALLAIAGTMVMVFFLAKWVPQELAPAEDRGLFFVSLSGPEGAGFDYTVKQMEQLEGKLEKYIKNGQIARLNTRAPRGFGGQTTEDFSTGQAVVVMPPWNMRSNSTQATMEQVSKDINQIPGVIGFPQMRQGFGRGFGQPVQFVLLGSSFEELSQWRDLLLPELQKNPALMGVDFDYKETKPQLRLQIDRNRAADLGISSEDIALTLDTMTSSRRVTTFAQNGEEYDVIVQAGRDDRSAVDDLQKLYVRSKTGALVSLGNLMQSSERAEASSFNRFNRTRALTISARLAPGASLGPVLAQIEARAKAVLPAQMRFDYKGDSREFKQSGAAAVYTLALALLVVYLVLAAQFESFLHPLVVMITVPLALFGALLGLKLFGSTLNLFSQIGIVMLVGLAAKNGILIVEFANQLRDQGRSILEATLEGASVRLRPIVMTSCATIAGALPLLFAHGAGSQSRFTIGVVIVSGVTVSTLFSLFLVPMLYTLAAPFTKSPEAMAQKIAQEEHEQEAHLAHSEAPNSVPNTLRT
jgi:multidrug efflux pump